MKCLRLSETVEMNSGKFLVGTGLRKLAKHFHHHFHFNKFVLKVKQCITIQAKGADQQSVTQHAYIVLMRILQL